MPLAVWLLACSAGLLALALGYRAPAYSPAARFIRSYQVRHPAAAAVARAAAGIGALGRRLLAWAHRRALARNYPDLLAHLSIQSMAGAHILEAFATAPRAVPEPMRSELRRLVADLSVSPLPAALERFGRKTGIPEVRALVEVLQHHQRLGFPLAEALGREETHCLTLMRQQTRRRIQISATILAAVTAILLFNALILYFVPAVQTIPVLTGG